MIKSHSYEKKISKKKWKFVKNIKIIIYVYIYITWKVKIMTWKHLWPKKKKLSYDIFPLPFITFWFLILIFISLWYNFCLLVIIIILKSMIFLILRKCASIYEVFSTTAFRKQCTIQRNYISHIALATCHVSPTAKHGTCLALQQLNRLTEKDHWI